MRGTTLESTMAPACTLGPRLLSLPSRSTLSHKATFQLLSSLASTSSVPSSWSIFPTHRHHPNLSGWLATSNSPSHALKVTLGSPLPAPHPKNTFPLQSPKPLQCCLPQTNLHTLGFLIILLFQEREKQKPQCLPWPSQACEVREIHSSETGSC